MKKILITGALGYIATSFVHILDHFFARDRYKICGIDSEFIPSRVVFLRNRGIQYFQKDLIDCDDLVREADIIIHAGGITDVPQVASQATPEKDALIKKVGTDGTRSLLKNCKKDAHFIFLSTHVVFEGYEKKFNITEALPPYPLLAYAQSKVQSEIDIQNSGLDYTILRLGSVYGYNHAIRWKIVANLFCKMAAINKKINVFGACSYKPLVSQTDVARAIFESFTEESFKNQIFHVVGQNTTVSEIAQICKKIKPEIEVNFKQDDSLNEAYSLSNEKILSTGFQFVDQLETEMSRMIQLWSEIKQR